MKHNIRINGVIRELNCELGSGVVDRHGREIFENDTVMLINGFEIKYERAAPEKFWVTEMSYYDSEELEVFRHNQENEVETDDTVHG